MCCCVLSVVLVVIVVDVGRLLLLGGACFRGFLFIVCCGNRCRCHLWLMLLLHYGYNVLLFVVYISVFSC